MDALKEFRKACPVGLCLHERLNESQAYKYYVCGKGCTLGVLFEDSVNIYFEWIAEGGLPVDYPASLRYKAWPKREVARLICSGVWEVTGSGAVPA